MKADKKKNALKTLGKWYHSISLGNGIVTKGDPGNNRFKWSMIRSCLPKNMSSSSLLDLGCAEGYFSLRCMMRGCKNATLVERNDDMIKRLNFVMDIYNKHTYTLVNDEIKHLMDKWVSWRRLGEEFDYVFALAVYHWVGDPILFIEWLGGITKKKCLFEIIVNDKDKSGLNTDRSAKNNEVIKWKLGKGLFKQLCVASGFRVKELGDYVTSFNSHRAMYELSK